MVPDTLTEGLKMAVSDSVQLSAPGDEVHTAVHLSLFSWSTFGMFEISDSFQILKEESLLQIFHRIFLKNFKKI
jgi:hypothetical protein